MRSATFWRTITVDESGFLERLLAKLERSGVPYCVIGGQAVNAYVEPLVSLDLDLAIAANDLERLLPELGYEFDVERFEHSLNVASRDSDLRVQFQLDPRYAEFVPRREMRTVLGHELPVARLEDVLAGKVWAASDASRRPSKRQKDLADIARILERFPELAAAVPAEIHARLV
ncbi:MAG: nucleotidyl transferase AbiEii/AbiGii toxin family protein [Thermoanaerobaculia bacterium]